MNNTRIRSPISPEALHRCYAWPERSTCLRGNIILANNASPYPPSKSTREISNTLDRYIIGLHRRTSDAVLVGAQTAIDEMYTYIVGNENHPPPTLIIVSRTCAFPIHDLVKNFHGDMHKQTKFVTQRPLFVTTSSALSASQASETKLRGTFTLLLCGENEINYAQLFHTLAKQNIKKILTEGGPRLMEYFYRNKLLTQLALTNSPLPSITSKHFQFTDVARDPNATLKHQLIHEGYSYQLFNLSPLNLT